VTEHDAEAILIPAAVPSDHQPSVNPRRRRGIRVTTAAAVALGLALGGGAVAGAATKTPAASTASTGPAGRPPMGGSPPVAVGTVKTVGDETFTVTTKDGTVTVKVTSSTTYRDAGVSSPGLANVTVGKQVAVFGRDTDSVITATSVGVGAPLGGGKGGPGGRGGPGSKGGPGGGSPPSGSGHPSGPPPTSSS
jgi:hypothetical protein